MKKLFVDHYCDTKLLNVIDEDEYRNFLRMDNSTFLLLLEKVGPLISKKDTITCECASALKQLYGFWPLEDH